MVMEGEQDWRCLEHAPEMQQHWAVSSKLQYGSDMLKAESSPYLA